jgi:hypothetical protein
MGLNYFLTALLSKYTVRKAVLLLPCRCQENRMYSSYSFLTSALDGDDWSVSCPGHALPPGKDPSTHWIRGWVGVRAGLNTEARGKILCLCQGSNPSPPVYSQTIYILSYSSSCKYVSNYLPFFGIPPLSFSIHFVVLNLMTSEQLQSGNEVHKFLFNQNKHEYDN